MSALSNGVAGRGAAEELAKRINAELEKIPDKTWNYSRLRLVVRDLPAIRAPFALGCDWIDPRTKAGQKQLAELERDLEWGRRHSDDLSFLELASLRINRALHTTDVIKNWSGAFPVLRVVSCDQLRVAGSAVGLWYEVDEVRGEDFEKRGR